MKTDPTGIIFEFQRFSIHDGPGVRTTVFLKGCPLRCLWCCNPESQAKSPQIMIRADKCLDCGKCLPVCPEQIALPASAGGFIDRDLCRGCGLCVEACPVQARALVGREVGAEEALSIIRRDAPFYRASGGGVTFSGGEPLSQPRFLDAMIDGCRAGGIGVVIETCGMFDWTSAKEVLLKVELIYLDIKHLDSDRHRSLTGAGNETILENVIRIAESNLPLIVRIPLIPGLNDSPADLTATADFVRKRLPSAQQIQLMPYHRLGLAKYDGLGREYKLEGTGPPDQDTVDRLQKVVDSPLIRVA